MPCPFQIFSQSAYLIQIFDINSNTEWQTVWIQISWLLRSQLIWIYTVCKGRVYRGSAGQGLIICPPGIWKSVRITQYFSLHKQAYCACGSLNLCSECCFFFRDERDSTGGRPVKPSGSSAGSSSSDQRGSGPGSAFEAYKQPLSTFGKSEQNGPQSPIINEDLRNLPR